MSLPRALEGEIIHDPALAARVRGLLDGQPDGDVLGDMLGVQTGAPRDRSPTG